MLQVSRTPLQAAELASVGVEALPYSAVEDDTAAELRAHVGQRLGSSEWVVVDQAMIDRFAEATGDHQWIHVDVERANREMGGPIAHGYLTLSLIPLLSAGVMRITGVARGINYGSDTVRFTNMVRVGKRVRMRQKVLDVQPKSGGMQIKNECTIEIEGEDRPACVAETITVVYGK